VTRRRLGLLLFGGAVLLGTVLDARARTGILAPVGNLLVADLHAHPYPGDGSLTIAQLQREAERRGVDVIGITGHNNQFGLGLSSLLGTPAGGPLVIPGQEVTSADFHMAAVGISRVVDWRLTATEAVAAVQSQGGVAIAAHPIGLINTGWDDSAWRLLDGAEVMHPLRLTWAKGGEELDGFLDATRAVNPGVAPIGSTDFHMTAPLGLCRTYILAEDHSATGVVQAIRDGRTVATCGDGDLVGETQHVAAVRTALASRPLPAPPGLAEKSCAFLALVSLALLAAPSRQ
jgi:hypothetical protein